MSQFPKRTEHSFWHNKEPYTDPHEVLELLRSESPTYEPLHLDRCRSEEYEWEIVVPWYTHGSSGGDMSGHNYYQIAADLAKQLVEEGLVRQRTIPHMGYTETRENEFVISPKGESTLTMYLKEMREKAETMLIPGIHTDLTGTIDYRGHGRDGWREGPLYFQFQLPEERGQCKVYPESERIVMPDEPEAEAA